MIKIGQVFKQENERMLFLGFKGGEHKIEFWSYAKQRVRLLKMRVGNKVMEHKSIKILEEFDFETYGKVMQEKQELNTSRNEKEVDVRNMKTGQIFIGNDNVRYAFEKFNRTRFAFHIEGNVFKAYSGKVGFVKEITNEFEKKKEYKLTETLSPQKLKLCKEYVEMFVDECGLHNEGLIAHKDGIEIYNDGYQCNAMINGKYVLGIELEEGALKVAEENMEIMRELGLLDKKVAC